MPNIYGVHDVAASTEPRIRSIAPAIALPLCPRLQIAASRLLSGLRLIRDVFLDAHGGSAIGGDAENPRRRVR